MMTEREIFDAALAITDPAGRAAWLDEACRGDTARREHIAGLLEAHLKLGSFLEAPPSAVADETGPTTDRPPLERPGMKIGPYKLLQQIGEGGMGVVYMAEQEQPVRRRVALKIIKPGMDSRQVIARFEAERQALAVMDHPNIARVVDAGATESGRPYFVMELVRGTPITQYCDENSLPIRERLALFAAVCQAIQHAHTKGIIHRDIKPSNVLVTRQDGQPVVKVIDFGIAKAMGQQLTDKTLFTDFAQMIGTPLYMSPEQAELSSTDIDTRSDIYSLGVLLYELLTGSTPVSKEQLRQAAFDEIRRIIREDEAERPSTRISSAEAAPSIAAQRHTEPATLTRLVRGELDWIVMKALEKDRSRRYETATGFAADVQRYLNDEAVQACPPSAWYRFRKSARRNRVVLTVTAIVAAALLLGIVGTTWQAIRASWQRDRAVAAEGLASKRLVSVTRARQDADQQRKLAVNNADEAARNLREARKAVDDWFTKISQSTLLEAPGLQPLRKELLEAALTYYRELLKQSQNHPELRADVAAAQMRLSVIYISFDRNDDALVAMLQGLDLVEQLIRERPGDTELPRRLAGYFKWSRDLFSRTRAPRDPVQAIVTLKRSAEIWEQFIRDNPTLPELQGDLAGMYLLLSVLHQGRDEALVAAYLDQSLDILEKLVRARPDLATYQEALVVSFDQKAYSLLSQNKAEAAEQVGRRAIDYFQELSQANPKALSPRLSLAKVQHILAYKIRLLQPPEAEKIFRQEVALMEELLAEAPTNPHVRQQLYSALDGLIALLQREGRDEAADELSERAQITIERLILDYPDAAEYRDRFAKSIAVRANRLLASQPNQVAEAEQLYRRALAVQEQLVADFPEQVRYVEDLTGTQRRLLDVLRARGNVAGVIDLHRQIIARSERLAAQFPDEEAHHRELAKSHNRLGLVLREAGQAAASEAELLKAQELWRSRESLEVHAARKAAEADPKNIHRWHDLFIAYYENGEWENCLGAIKKKHQVGGPSAWEWFHEAMAHRQLNHSDEALEKFHTAIDWMDRADNRQAKLREYQAEAAIVLGFPDPGLRVDQANGYLKKGTELEKAGQSGEAKDAYGKAIEIYETLAADFPLALAYAQKLIDLLTKCGRQSELAGVYRRAIAARENLPVAAPSIQLAIANQCNDLAVILMKGGQRPEAEEFFRKAIQLKQNLVTEFPASSDYRFHLAHSYLGLAYVLEESGREPEVVQATTDAAKIFSQLAADESAVADFRQWNAHGLWKVGDIWLKHERWDDGKQAYEQALATFQQLEKFMPSNRFYRQEQGFCYRLLARTAELVGHLDECLQQQRLAVGIYRKLVAEVPDSEFYRNELAYVERQLAELQAPLQKPQPK